MLAFTPDLAMRFQGTLYRALNPVYARQPLSGRGAELYGGRFNPKGVPALYLSLSVMTAIREANQVGHLQPTTLVSYEAHIENVFDSGDTNALAAYGMNVQMLADSSWRDQMRSSGEAKTQAFAMRLVADGYHGLMVQSFVHGAKTTDMNMVLWTWGDAAPSKLVAVDEENHLGRSTK